MMLCNPGGISSLQSLCSATVAGPLSDQTGVAVLDSILLDLRPGALCDTCCDCTADRGPPRERL